MTPIIEPIDKELLQAELTDELLWRQTNKAGNLIYIFRAAQAPAVMREVGRLRELTFRNAGGGTGKAVDIDEYDTDPDGYYQLIVWDPREREIWGGYRYIIPRSSYPRCLSTEHYFSFSDRFRMKYLPYTIELGRSFIQPKFQAGSAGFKGLFALDNLWDGIGSVIVSNPDIKYLFGKVTMYDNYNREAKKLLIYFLRKYFPDHENLIHTKYPANLWIDEQKMSDIFSGRTFGEDYKILSKYVRDYQEVIPPLINSYMQLSPTMKVFETAVNPDFGNVEETGILLTIGDLYKERISRHFVDDCIKGAIKHQE